MAAGFTSPAAMQVFELSGMPGGPPKPSPVSLRRLPPWRHRRRAIWRSAWMTGKFWSGPAPVPAPGGLTCPTALAFGDADSLHVCQGSAEHRASDWVVDLMEKKATGSVWRIDLGSGKAVLPGRWARLSLWRDRGRRRQRRDRLRELASPAAAAAGRRRRAGADPDRSCRAIRRGCRRRADGGAWLTLFAPRNRLIEFVLQEQEYRAT